MTVQSWRTFNEIVYIEVVLVLNFISNTMARERESAVKRMVFTHQVANFDEPPTFDVEECEWLIYKAEIGSVGGNRHWQGAVIFKKRQRYATAGAILGIRGAHFEVMRGTVQDQRVYIGKAETTAPGHRVHEFGEPSNEGAAGQGRRSDLARMAEEIKEGSNLRDVALSAPATYIRNYRGIGHFRNLVFNQRRSWPTELHILIGPPGCGKSRSVYDAHDANDIYPKNPKHNYWNGYVGQSIVLIDDYRGPAPGGRVTGNPIDFDDLLRLADRYPMDVDCKMADPVNFVAKKIYITSNCHYREWFPYGTDLAPLERRITVVREWRAGEVPVPDVPFVDLSVDDGSLGWANAREEFNALLE